MLRFSFRMDQRIINCDYKMTWNIGTLPIFVEHSYPRHNISRHIYKWRCMQNCTNYMYVHVYALFQIFLPQINWYSAPSIHWRLEKRIDLDSNWVPQRCNHNLCKARKKVRVWQKGFCLDHQWQRPWWRYLQLYKSKLASFSTSWTRPTISQSPTSLLMYVHNSSLTL